MITPRCSTLILLLLAANFAYSADHSTNTITSILQSYANAFTAHGPQIDNRPVSSVYHPVPYNYVRLTTTKPDEQRLVEVTAEPSIEVGSSNFVEKNADAHRADSSSEESDENTDPEGPPDHVIPHSEHENPREPSTRPNYTAPGNWAKPPPDKNIPLEFVPTKLYAQVRGTHTVAHLPREEAVNSAQTDEEKENAARLKEVVKISKANTVYTEEGYEDAAYDHAGQIRDADFHEGFAHKLNQELDREKGFAGNGDRPRKKSSKKHNKKPRKSKALLFDNYDDDYRDHLEVIEEARTNKQRIRPEDLKVLKSALQDSVVNPKNVVEDGIHRLEEDLRKEAYETQRTSTEPYATTTTTASPVQVATQLDEIHQETTTARHDIFTVRPRRIMPAVKPKTFLTKVKIPSQYYSSAKTNDYINNGEISTENYGSIAPYSVNDQSQKPAVGYQPIYSESQTVSPIITNPLALATVNGHGPYLFLVTSPPDPFTSRPLENHELTTTSTDHYLATPVDNTTSTGLTNAYSEHRPFLVTDRKSELTSSERYSPQYLRNNPQLYVEERPINSNFKPPKKFKTLPNHEKMLDYLRKEKNSYLDYYTVLQPPKPNPALITYSNYPRESYDNALNQWSVSQESVRPIESAYSALSKVSRPQIDAELQRASQPVTRLLPPAPLSASEYASFHLRNAKTESTTPSLMAIMPIIQAIHKYENSQQKAFPFLLRKKRSALGPSREWEIMQRDLKLQREAEPQGKQQSKLVNAGSAINEKKLSNNNFPAKFERLLHQSPRIADDVVNKEIRQRFKETSEESSSEASKESTIEGLDGESKEELNESSKEHGSVEVEVPELDFSDIFKEDEPEPTTKKPSIDIKKYPFYKSDEVSGNTALKYIVNPLDVPQKTLGGMEFYESRNLECEEIDPNLEKIVPEEEDLANKRGPRKNKPRLHGLGDKLDCYKAKYFDENPLDNPIFLEKKIEIPSVPKELDAKKFASRILELPPEKDEYVIQKGPKYPEQFRPTQRKVKQRNIPKHHFSEQNMNYNYAPWWQNSGYMNGRHQRHQEPPKVMFTNESKIRSNKTRSRTGTKKSNLRVTPPYQRQVYEDVMGTIMNLENMYKSPGSKRNASPAFSKFHNRENKKKEESSEPNRQKKRKPAEIEGLVPPPLVVNPTLHKANKYGYSNQRIRNNYNEGSLQRFKRSINAEDKNKNFLNHTNTNNINNNTNELKRKNPFRIILTTPIPEQFRPTRQAVTIIKDEPTTTTERIIYTINDRIRHSYRNREDLGRYNKFENQENTTSSTDTRRKEPRYNNAYKRNSIRVPTSNLTSNNSLTESSSVTPLPPVDSTFSASTIIPVIVKPDENFTARVPQESKATYQKQKLEDKNEEEPEPENLENREDSEINNTEKPIKDVNKQYAVHENIKEDDKKVEETTEITDDGDKIEIITKYSSLPDSKEHKELYEFLKGDPPGYDKAFPPDESPERLESKKEESIRIAHSKEDDPTDEEIEELDENENENENEKENEKENGKENGKENEKENGKENEKENGKENEEQVGESTSENPEIEQNDNSEPVTEEEDNPNKNSKESDNEPFVRYSSRPYSPPENYEDELYSDLGPRINKPYFYHPPFEVPEYEKHTLGKTIDRSDNGDWEHKEETEDHDTYVFPWEADEEEKNEGEESQNDSRYEYPWEKRERKELERRKKEKLRGLHNKKVYGHEEDNGPEEEETVTRLVYVPLRKKYPRYYSYIVPRGKKDIKPVKRSSEQRPVTKFSSRYKSGVLKVPLDDEEMLITVANNDAIKQSIMNYLQKAVSTTPKSKFVHGSPKNVSGAANTINTVTFISNKTTRSKIENTMLKPPVNLTNPTIEKIINSTDAQVSTTTASPRQTRMRSRKAKVAASSETVINLQTSTTPASRVMRRRGRGRSVTTSSTAAPTTAASAKPNRRRNRLSTVSSTTSTTVSSTSKTLNDRRRRPSRSQFNSERIQKLPENKKNDQSSSTTLSSAPASTGRTIEHHSRVSKEEIITKTITNGDDSDEDDITDEDVSKSDNTKLASEKEPLYSKVTRRNKPKNDTDEHTVKEKVEKVTITMEETPNHVFKTEEIDKDGVKGKFVTITANNNTTPSRERNNNFRVKDDHDMEEMKKRMKDFNSFESVVQDSEEPNDDSSSNQEAENYLVGNLLQKSPVPIDRKLKGQETERLVEDDYSEDEDEDDNDDDDHENDDDEDGNDEIEDEENNSNNEGEKSDGLDKKNDDKSKKDTDNKEKKPSILIIKDPDSRRYFYVEQR